MAYLIKIIVATLVIVLVTELSKKDTKLAALLLALPIISFTAYTMIWFESKEDTLLKLDSNNLPVGFWIRTASESPFQDYTGWTRQSEQIYPGWTYISAFDPDTINTDAVS